MIFWCSIGARNGSTPRTGGSDSIKPIAVVSGSVKETVVTVGVFKTTPELVLEVDFDCLVSFDSALFSLTLLIDQWVAGLHPLIGVCSLAFWPHHFEVEFVYIWISHAVVELVEDRERVGTWVCWVDLQPVPFRSERLLRILPDGLSEQELPACLDWGWKRHDLRVSLDIELSLVNDPVIITFGWSGNS